MKKNHKLLICSKPVYVKLSNLNSVSNIYVFVYTCTWLSQFLFSLLFCVFSLNVIRKQNFTCFGFISRRQHRQYALKTRGACFNRVLLIVVFIKFKNRRCKVDVFLPRALYRIIFHCSVSQVRGLSKGTYCLM